MKHHFKSYCLTILLILIIAPVSFGEPEDNTASKTIADPAALKDSEAPKPAVKPEQIPSAPAPQKARPTSLQIAGIGFSDGANLGPWWRKSAKLYDPLPEAVLYHIRCDYGYARWAGNVEMEGHKGNLELTLRKDLYTSLTMFNLNKSTTTNVLRGKTTKIEDRLFVERLYHDVTERWAVLAAVRLERSLSKFIDNRWAYLGGVRFIVADTPDLQLRLNGLWGYARTEYANQEVRDIVKYSDFPGVDPCQSTAWAFLQQLNYRFSEMISLQESFDYLQLTAYSGYHSWKADVALNFKLTNRLTYFSQITSAYDKNSFINSLRWYLNEKRKVIGSQAGEVETLDTAFTTGIRFEF